MRILIVPSWYPTPSKPVNGIFVQEQAEALSKEHQVRVLFLDVLPRGGKQRPRKAVRRDRGFIEETIEVRNFPLLWQFAYLLAMARAFRRLRRTFRPDIIHCHTAVPAAWGATMLRWLVNVPIVLTEHTGQFEPWTDRVGLRWMAQEAFSNVDMVIAVSESQKQQIEKMFNRKEGITAVPNMVDTGRFTPTELPDSRDSYRLLFVGLMDDGIKGVPFLLEAIAKILKENSLPAPLHLDVVGDGSLRKSYEELARSLELEQVVTFHGLETRDVVATMMRECHALVLPSLSEAFSIVIIEAMASGRPVISTLSGGPESIVDARSGVLVEPGQSNLLADAIVEVLTHLSRFNPQEIASIAETRYSYKAVMGILTSIYANLVSKRANSPDKGPDNSNTG